MSDIESINHAEKLADRRTIFSSCRKYRYTLWRDWSEELKNSGVFFTEDPYAAYHIGTPDSYVQFIGLNPSTADENLDDPTIRRCIGFSKAWGFGAFCMTNLFAFRATDPKVMKNCDSPETPDLSLTNRQHIMSIASEAGLVIAAWGTHGSHMGLGADTILCFNQNKIKIHHLGLNADGTPKHPLYLKSSTLPEIYADSVVKL